MGGKNGVFSVCMVFRMGFVFVLLSLSLVFFSFQPLLCLLGLGEKGVQLLVLGGGVGFAFFSLFFPFFFFVLGISVRGGEFFLAGSRVEFEFEVFESFRTGSDGSGGYSRIITRLNVECGWSKVGGTGRGRFVLLYLLAMGIYMPLGRRTKPVFVCVRHGW